MPRVAGRALQAAAVLLAVVALVGTARWGLRFRHIFYNHPGDTITQPQVLEAYEKGQYDAADAVVPRIIHQVFHNWTDPSNEDVPADWEEARQSCIALNADWQYMLWTSTSSRDFIRDQYPWFLKTYDGLPNPVQRVDTVRYFLMLHYGGIYIDLDNGCLHSLEPLRYFPTWVTDGGRGTLSNNILGAAPNHPFWQLLTQSLMQYAWNYPLPYVTVSYATGQWFETDIWNIYHERLAPGEPPLMRVMMDDSPGAAPWTFFNHNRGSTWEDWDSAWFGWIGTHLLTVVVVVAGAVLLLVAVLVGAARAFGYVRTKRSGYRRVET